MEDRVFVPRKRLLQWIFRHRAPHLCDSNLDIILDILRKDKTIEYKVAVLNSKEQCHESCLK